MHFDLNLLVLFANMENNKKQIIFMRFYNICILFPSKYSLIYHRCKCERTLLRLTHVAARRQNVKHVNLT